MSSILRLYNDETNEWEDIESIKGADGSDGKDGQDGKSGVYIGEEPPTDESATVWINPNGTLDIISTVQNMIEEAIGSAINDKY